MGSSPEAVDELGRRLGRLGWVTDLWVGGSLATGDYVPGVSDLDLVAVVDGAVTPERRQTIAELHRDLDEGVAAGTDLGCQYVEAGRLLDRELLHPTWTHGAMVDRILSGITRVELVREGYAVVGRPPADVLPSVSDDEVREAARAELRGYWAWASRRPLMWLSPVIADLGLTSMARGRACPGDRASCSPRARRSSDRRLHPGWSTSSEPGVAGRPSAHRASAPAGSPGATRGVPSRPPGERS